MREGIALHYGFIGLGHMGSVMAANLAASGCKVTGYVLDPGRRSHGLDVLAFEGLAPLVYHATLPRGLAGALVVDLVGISTSGVRARRRTRTSARMRILSVASGHCH